MTAWFRVALAIACIAVSGLIAPIAHACDKQNLVNNGDFSADGGSLDGWTYNQKVDNFYWQFMSNNSVHYAYNGCTGDVCITPAGTTQNYLSQTIHTLPGERYTLTFTYNAGAGGVNELKVLFGKDVVKDVVNVGAGSNMYTVTLRARHPETVLSFLGRQDNGFALLTGISVVRDHDLHDWDHRDR
jgi:hypothetical protein